MASPKRYTMFSEAKLGKNSLIEVRCTSPYKTTVKKFTISELNFAIVLHYEAIKNFEEWEAPGHIISTGKC